MKEKTRPIDYTFKFFNVFKGEKNQAEVLIYLYQNGKIFKGGYTSLTKALNRPTGNLHGHVSNVRKAVLGLESKGIVKIYKPQTEGKTSTKITIELLDNWADKI